MHRRPLQRMLEQYLQRYPDERPMAARIVALVEEHSDCFDRTCRPGHVTGSAWVLTPDRRHCLLVHHRKLDRWLQPGGHADGDPDIQRVARREVEEEAGLSHLQLAPETEGLPIDVDVHQIPARYNATGELIEDAHQHHDVRFLFIATAAEPLSVSDESHEVRWFARDEVLQATNEQSVLRMLRKAGPC